MNGNTLIGGGPVTPNPGPSWKAVGTGDFNDDGNSDILWQNTSTGQVSIWEMDGNTLIGGGPVSPIPGRLGKRSERAISTATAFPTSCSRTRAPAKSRSGRWTGTPGSAAARSRQSRAELARHRNRDGGSDILLQNTSGQVSIWDMNGTTRSPAAGPSAPIPGRAGERSG